MIHSLKIITCSFFVCSLLALNGCGQKGDLYLPTIPPAPLVENTQDNSDLVKEDQNDDQKSTQKEAHQNEVEMPNKDSENTEKKRDLPTLK